MHLYVFESSFDIYYLVASLAYSLDMKMEGYKCMIMLVSTVILMVFPYRSSEIYRYAEEDLNLWKPETLPSVFKSSLCFQFWWLLFLYQIGCRDIVSVATPIFQGNTATASCSLMVSNTNISNCIMMLWLCHNTGCATTSQEKLVFPDWLWWLLEVTSVQCEINCQRPIDASLKTG